MAIGHPARASRYLVHIDPECLQDVPILYTRTVNEVGRVSGIALSDMPVNMELIYPTHHSQLVGHMEFRALTKTPQEVHAVVTPNVVQNQKQIKPLEEQNHLAEAPIHVLLSAGNMLASARTLTKSAPPRRPASTIATGLTVRPSESQPLSAV